MLTPNTNAGIYVYTQPVDMRKAINGLIVVIVDCMKGDPQSGDIFVFCNKTRDKVKLVFWDRNGFALYYKRMERCKFKFSYDDRNHQLVINTQQFRALLMGLDFNLMGEYPVSMYEDFF